MLAMISSHLSSDHSSHVLYTLFDVLMHELSFSFVYGIPLVYLFLLCVVLLSNCLDSCYVYNCCFMCMDTLPEYMSTHASHGTGVTDKCETSGRVWE